MEKKRSTKVSRIIRASREVIYQAFLDANKVAFWRVPDNMKARVHAFNAREGGTYRMSLVYIDENHSSRGKTSEDMDTFQGQFLELLPNERIVELIRFESDDPEFEGEMKMTTSLASVEAGTEVSVLCENLPEGILPEDNELGCQLALRNLARLVE